MCITYYNLNTNINCRCFVCLKSSTRFEKYYEVHFRNVEMIIILSIYKAI